MRLDTKMMSLCAIEVKISWKMWFSRNQRRPFWKWPIYSRSRWKKIWHLSVSHTLVQKQLEKTIKSILTSKSYGNTSHITLKVFESILNSHFLKHLVSLSLLSHHQYGFCKARYTGDLLSYLTHIWSSYLWEFGESFVVALDISKAFNRVWHKALLAKLPSFGFTILCY